MPSILAAGIHRLRAWPPPDCQAHPGGCPVLPGRQARVRAVAAACPVCIHAVLRRALVTAERWGMGDAERRPSSWTLPGYPSTRSVISRRSGPLAHRGSRPAGSSRLPRMTVTWRCTSPCSGRGCGKSPVRWTRCWAADGADHRGRTHHPGISFGTGPDRVSRHGRYPVERDVVNPLLKDLVGESPVGQGAGDLERPDHEGEDAEGRHPCRTRIVRRQALGDVVDHSSSPSV